MTLKPNDIIEMIGNLDKGRIIDVHAGQGSIAVKVAIKGVISEECFPDDSVEVLTMYLTYILSMLVEAMHEYEISDDVEVLTKCVYSLLQAE